MFKKIAQVLGVYAIVAFMTVAPLISSMVKQNDTVEVLKPTEIEIVEETVEVKMEEIVYTPVPVEAKMISFKEIVKESTLPEDEIDLIALVTMAEAEGESEYGKRLVIDTILNRVDSDDFPDTVDGVIYQKSQFSCMWDGRINSCYVSEDICQLVREELESRTNGDVLFFRTKHYSNYGTPLFVEGNHYFSTI